MNFLFYLVQVNLYLILFYAFYRVLLFGETFYTFNRLYLVLSAVLSFGIPLWYSEYVQSWFITQEISSAFYTIYDPSMILIRPTKEISFTWADILQIFYIIGITVFAIRLIITLLQLVLILKRKNFEQFSAFSFFGYSFVDKTLAKRETILAHEHVHVQQLHSADVLLFEMIAILNWFNPVVYFYKKDIKHIHEFIADEIAAQNEPSKADYAMLLFSQEFGLQPHQLANTFFNHSTLKRRIQMLNKPRSRKIMLMKYGLSVPLFILMLVLSSATIVKNEVFEIAIEDITETPVTELPKIKELSLEIADNKIVMGKVVASDDRRPLPGVTVKIKGEDNSTTTDINGEYKIIAMPEDELVFSFPGFEKLTVSVTNKTMINVSLNPTNGVSQQMSTRLSEVVVSGYGNNSRSMANEEIFESVEENPEFPGGVRALFAFIGQNLRYPVEAQQNNISGKVFVKFIIRKDGYISDLKVLKGVGYGCDEETVRVLSQMPRWKAGRQNGREVNVWFTMPVSFVIDEKNRETDVLNSTGIEWKGLNDPIPIFIVDGKELKQNDINDLKSDEIESMSVLKGIDATNSYGEKAKNGVILITTKNPKDNNDVKKIQLRSGIPVSGNARVQLKGVKSELIIVDGLEINKDAFNIIKPDRIESVNVLTGVTATNSYGERGKNGVIIIKTKKASGSKRE